ncbi:unnamed protein product [Closterium sp. Naga37s-1]|nr:unnamed protein product [Closterium sp. Naga37s-1]
MLRRAAAKGPPTGPLEGKASRFARSTRIASFVGVLVLLVVTTFCYTNHYFATVSDDSVHPDDLSDQESTSEASARGSDQTFPTVKPSATEKIAFLFLTRGPLPLVPLWDRFFQGHEGRYSVYVHASTPAFAFPPDFSPTFRDALIPGGKVAWGDFSMVAAERKLLATAFFDPLNAFFALLSDSCIPLWPFTFIYSYVASANVSLLDAHHNKYRMGFRRYERHIFSPLIRKDDYVGGSQVGHGAARWGTARGSQMGHGAARWGTGQPDGARGSQMGHGAARWGTGRWGDSCTQVTLCCMPCTARVWEHLCLALCCWCSFAIARHSAHVMCVPCCGACAVAVVCAAEEARADDHEGHRPLPHTPEELPGAHHCQ